MKKKLEEKVAIVTGGARGLGKGIVISLLKNGCKVLIFDENISNGENTTVELNKKFNDSVIFFNGNVALKKDNIAAVETAIKTFGRLDILSANAGIFPLTWLKDISENEWDEVMNVNLKGPFFLTKYFLKNSYFCLKNKNIAGRQTIYISIPYTVDGRLYKDITSS